jgi:replicative DNA helicase
MDLARRVDVPPSLEPSVLRALATDPDLLGGVRAVVTEDMFRDPVNATIFASLVKYHEKYGEIPSRKVLMELVSESGRKEAYEAAERCSTLRPVKDLKFVRDRVVDYARWRAVDAAFESADEMTVDELAKAISDASRLGCGVGDGFSTLDAGLDFLQEKGGGLRVPTPWPSLNGVFNGGPESGDFCVLMSFMNVGKTACLVNVAMAAAAQGASVVYFTFEDGERKIRRRMTQCLTGMTIQQMVMDSEKAKRKMQKFLEASECSVVIKELIPRRATVSDALGFIRSVEARTGRKVDLVVTDYADRFRATSRSSEPRHGYREIFEDCKGLAMETKSVHWTASQVQRGRASEEEVRMEHVSEAIGKMESPDLVVGLGQRKEDERIGRIVATNAKVRDGEKGGSWILNADFKRQRVLE